MENIARNVKDKKKKREHSEVEIKEFKNQNIQGRSNKHF